MVHSPVHHRRPVATGNVLKKVLPDVRKDEKGCHAHPREHRPSPIHSSSGHMAPELELKVCSFGIGTQ